MIMTLENTFNRSIDENGDTEIQRRSDQIGSDTKTFVATILSL